MNNPYGGNSMKKFLLSTALVLAIAVSVISGTMALYTTKIDNVADGSVVAKEFVLHENGTDSFVKDVKIAPTETVTWSFGVRNFEGNILSETAMALSFTVDIEASNGKQAIDPLVVTIKNEAGTVVGTQTGSGVISFNDNFALKSEGQAHTYTVVVNWPSSSADAAYVSDNGSFGTSIRVGVTGTQE